MTNSSRGSPWHGWLRTLARTWIHRCGLYSSLQQQHRLHSGTVAVWWACAGLQLGCQLCPLSMPRLLHVQSMFIYLSFVIEAHVVQGNATAQHAQIQKIRASIARDIAISKRSGPTGTRKRQPQRTHPPQQHPVLRAPSGLPDVVLGEIKSLVRAPGPPQAKAKVATGAASDSKKGSFRASSNSTPTVASTEARDCKTSVGRLQSGRKGSNSSGTGATASTCLLYTSPSPRD